MINGKSLIPVWEDTYYEYSGDTLYFRVKMDGVSIYDGYAEAFPDGTPIRVYINRIAGDYLFNSESFDPGRAGYFLDSGASANFTLVRMNVSGNTYTEGTTLGDVTILFGFGDVYAGVISDPVNGHSDMRMKLPVTGFFANISNAMVIDSVCDGSDDSGYTIEGTRIYINFYGKWGGPYTSRQDAVLKSTFDSFWKSRPELESTRWVYDSKNHVYLPAMYIRSGYSLPGYTPVGYNVPQNWSASMLFVVPEGDYSNAELSVSRAFDIIRRYVTVNTTSSSSLRSGQLEILVTLWQ